MEEVFIKTYVLISLWLWAGMLLSSPLRNAFYRMHRRLLKRICDVTLGRLIKVYRKIAVSISGRFKTTAVYVENRTYDLRVKVARSLVNKELLEELSHKNLVAAIARVKQMDQYSGGTPYEELERLGRLVMGRPVDNEAREAALKTAFELCNTGLFEQIITRIPRAQERILLAFERAEGDAPYDSVKNEEYRKFIRE